MKRSNARRSAEKTPKPAKRPLKDLRPKNEREIAAGSRDPADGMATGRR